MQHDHVSLRGLLLLTTVLPSSPLVSACHRRAQSQHHYRLHVLANVQGVCGISPVSCCRQTVTLFQIDCFAGRLPCNSTCAVVPLVVHVVCACCRQSATIFKDDCLAGTLLCCSTCGMGAGLMHVACAFCRQNTTKLTVDCFARTLPCFSTL